MTYGEFLATGDCSPYADAERVLRNAGPTATSEFYALKREIDQHNYSHVATRLEAFWQAYNAYQRQLGKAAYQLRKARRNTITIGNVQVSHIRTESRHDNAYCFVGTGPMAGLVRGVPAREAKKLIIMLQQAA